MARSVKSLPYSGDVEYVEAELGWLRARCARLSADRRRREIEAEEAAPDPTSRPRPGAIALKLSRCNVAEAKEDETRIRAEIDARLEAHGRTPNAPNLGLASLCEELGLSVDEKVILLTCTAHALGQAYSDYVFGDLTQFTSYSGPDVGDAASVVGWEGLADLLKLRAALRPASPLVASSTAVVEDPIGKVRAPTMMTRAVLLSLQGYRRIFGDEGVLSEEAVPGTDDL